MRQSAFDSPKAEPPRSYSALDTKSKHTIAQTAHKKIENTTSNVLKGFPKIFLSEVFKIIFMFCPPSMPSRDSVLRSYIHSVAFFDVIDIVETVSSREDRINSYNFRAVYVVCELVDDINVNTHTAI